LQGNELSFCSRGDKLQYHLEYYTQPFTKCDANVSESFGLGLYIVNYILDKHEYTLSYSYKDGINYFTVTL
jgi:two-component system OmpR family sensor kinase